LLYLNRQALYLMQLSHAAQDICGNTDDCLCSNASSQISRFRDL